jgi:hypothetical protein
VRAMRLELLGQRLRSCRSLVHRSHPPVDARHCSDGADHGDVTSSRGDAPCPSLT